MTREYIEKAVADITKQLKGYMSNGDRALLVAERKDLRDLLKKMDAEEAK